MNKKLISFMVAICLLISCTVFGFAGNGNGNSKGATMFHNAQQLGISNKEHVYIPISDEVYDFTYTGSKLTTATQAPVDLDESYEVYRDVDCTDLIGEITLIEHGNGNHKDAGSASDEYWIYNFNAYVKPVIIEDEDEDDTTESPADEPQIIPEDPTENSPVTEPPAEEQPTTEPESKELETTTPGAIEGEIIPEEPKTEPEEKHEEETITITTPSAIEDPTPREEPVVKPKKTTEIELEENIEELILNEDVPLSDLPDIIAEKTEPEPEAVAEVETIEEFEVFDEEVPLADVPTTGDNTVIYVIAAMLSALLMLVVLHRKEQ